MFTKQCPGCRTVRGSLCQSCRIRLVGDSQVFIGFDAGPVSGTALAYYDDFAQRVILAAKNGGRTDVLRDLGILLTDILFTPSRSGEHPAVVSWIPASRSGRRARGYDPGRLLARSVGRELNHMHLEVGVDLPVKVRPLFTRGGGCRQTGRSRRQRLDGPDLRWLGSDPIARLILVDDVVTTGSSMRSAVSLAVRHGAVSVDAVALASVR